MIWNIVWFIGGMLVVILFIQLMYFANKLHNKKGEDLISSGKSLLEEKQIILDELDRINKELENGK
jgi:hypothetical protein